MPHGPWSTLTRHTQNVHVQESQAVGKQSLRDAVPLLFSLPVYPLPGTFSTVPWSPANAEKFGFSDKSFRDPNFSEKLYLHKLCRNSGIPISYCSDEPTPMAFGKCLKGKTLIIHLPPWAGPKPFMVTS